jgi:hypothetical protein
MNNSQELDRDVVPADEEIDTQTTTRLIAFGFDPGIPVYEINKPEFDVDLLKRAVFESTYRNPITITFRSDKGEMCETPLEEGLEMVVEFVQVFYGPREPHVGSGLVGCYNEPEWYVRGFLYKSGVDPYPEVLQMHAYLQSNGEELGKIDQALLQIVRNASGANPVDRMVRARKWYSL